MPRQRPSDEIVRDVLDALKPFTTLEPLPKLGEEISSLLTSQIIPERKKRPIPEEEPKEWKEKKKQKYACFQCGCIQFPSCTYRQETCKNCIEGDGTHFSIDQNGRGIAIVSLSDGEDYNEEVPDSEDEGYSLDSGGEEEDE